MVWDKLKAFNVASYVLYCDFQSIDAFNLILYYELLHVLSTIISRFRRDGKKYFANFENPNFVNVKLYSICITETQSKKTIPLCQKKLKFHERGISLKKRFVGSPKNNNV